ncbi:MAG: ParB/RepB/Spo0J family partition protein [Coriobacteriales bacterium]|nr:ParB/RepB/Spo0J family partition protein [Coriobacteriales bacterium]
MAKKKALGKGLDVLLAEADLETTKSSGKKLNIKDIKPNPNQPRKTFDKHALEELASSIKTDGLLSPVIVREKDDYYEIVAGERRYQASILAGLKEIDVRIMDFDDVEALKIALIENVQRDDLNPLEQAKAYKALMLETGATQAELAKDLSKSRSNIANLLRLLDLPENIQTSISNGVISAGHARAILSIKEEKKQQALANKIINEQISVREAERLAKLYNLQVTDPSPVKHKEKQNNQYSTIQNSLSECLETKVKIISSDKKKELVIEFSNLPDLKRIQQIIES